MTVSVVVFLQKRRSSCCGRADGNYQVKGVREGGFWGEEELVQECSGVRDMSQEDQCGWRGEMMGMGQSGGLAGPCGPHRLTSGLGP